MAASNGDLKNSGLNRISLSFFSVEAEAVRMSRDQPLLFTPQAAPWRGELQGHSPVPIKETYQKFYTVIPLISDWPEYSHLATLTSKGGCVSWVHCEPANN